MEWMLMPLKRYADFQGRSRRKEYWMFQLGIVLVYVAFAVLSAILGAVAGETGTMIASIPLLLLLLGILVPALAVTVRRFHDQDKSGWMALLGLIPFVGGIIVLVFMCLEGTKGPNQFGPDPKDQDNTTVFE